MFGRKSLSFIYDHIVKYEKFNGSLIHRYQRLQQLQLQQQQQRYQWNNFSLRALIYGNHQQQRFAPNISNGNDSNSKLLNDHQQQQQQQQQRQQNKKDQFILDHLNSSQDISTPYIDTLPIAEQDLVSKEPPREHWGILKAIIIIVAGIYFGAWVAMIGAKLLEDLDIYVQDHDDDDNNGD